MQELVAHIQWEIRPISLPKIKSIWYWNSFNMILNRIRALSLSLVLYSLTLEKINSMTFIRLKASLEKVRELPLLILFKVPLGLFTSAWKSLILRWELSKLLRNQANQKMIWIISWEKQKFFVKFLTLTSSEYTICSRMIKATIWWPSSAKEEICSLKLSSKYRIKNLCLRKKPQVSLNKFYWQLTPATKTIFATEISNLKISYLIKTVQLR